MKVLHVLSSNKYSGAENVACQIISMMKDIPDFEMAYCSPNGEIESALYERNILYLPIENMNVTELRKVFQKYQPDLIHAHDMRASFISTRASGKIPVVAHIHNNAFESRKISLKSIAFLVASFKLKHIFWVSNSAKEGYRFSKLVRSRSSVLQNIIDMDMLKEKVLEDSKDYHYDIIYLGRLSYEKNPERLLDIMIKVVDIIPNAKMAIIGSGDLNETLNKKCNDLKLNNNVSFLGHQSNPYKILSQAKVMLMTSRWEGLPMCALEAFSLGIPIVSTPTDGLKELIESGITGYYSSNDDFLAEKLEEIISNPRIQQKLSGSALAKSKEVNDIKRYRSVLVYIYTKSL